MNRWIRASAAALAALLLFAAPAAALDFSSLVTFGDSLVDAGNTQNAVVGAFGPGADPTPAADGYYDGRFANGPVASDVLNAAISGGDSVASSEGGLNYSFGGARSRNNDLAEGFPIPDLELQVAAYLGDTAGVADSAALYFINVGGNDIRDILFSPDPVADAPGIINAAVFEIVTQISVLSAAGAQNFLVAGVGDVGSIPETLAAGPAASAFARSVSESFNTALFSALPAGVIAFDTIALFDAVLADPAAYGLPVGINITDACLTAGGSPPGGTPACNDYAFFDSVHPTTQVAGIFGDALVAAVPEPTTALLVAVGLFAMGTRRRVQR